MMTYWQNSNLFIHTMIVPSLMYIVTNVNCQFNSIKSCRNVHFELVSIRTKMFHLCLNRILKKYISCGKFGIWYKWHRLLEYFVVLFSILSMCNVYTHKHDTIHTFVWDFIRFTSIFHRIDRCRCCFFFF